MTSANYDVIGGSQAELKVAYYVLRSMLIIQLLKRIRSLPFSHSIGAVTFGI